ncbi:DNA repair protein RecN [Idiomarina xiamenensis]|uniref:DNA repair protein RecN n=1 Tax=Idiomarina xiamenensis 10-D-4 TaxID=740709 RepID=K2KB53_9GAMM|nr:DNA repair protein RecN [Idiomarina xiamenensis]EKE83797.1 DNA repair ATPase RecN [Idiomarina xiamenensis 10-D-4]
MLTELHVKHFAVVKSLSIEFKQGMTAITGETGAGKSIALDALSLCLGDRADAQAVRPGADKAEVIACFQVTLDSPAYHWLQAHEFNTDDCVLRRVVTREGRSKAWINGSPVPAAQLKSLAPLLVNIHGQHEHQLLTRDEHQLQLLDQYAGHNSLLMQVTERYQQWAQLQREWKQLKQQRQEYEAQRQLLQYQVSELDEFALAEGEFDDIEEQHRRLAHTATLADESLFALNAIYEGEHNNAFSLIQTALERLRQQLSIDNGLQGAVDMLSEGAVQIEEATRELRHYQESLDSDPALLAHLDKRMSGALQLAKKHQIEPAQLYQHHQQLRQQLQTIDAAGERSEGLETAIEQARQQYRQAAQQLSESRQHAAQQLGQRISDSMQKLNMAHGRFVIEVEHQAQAAATKSGTDEISFMVSTNPGQPLQPLAKVASGGELSRISLAIQVMTSTQLTTPTLMFDEVDVGVSGPTAAVVGAMLRSLGAQAQIICVTHLPQVAAKAHQQLLVSKLTDGQQTETQVLALNHDDRIQELARLLGGDHITATTRANAEELLAG